MVEFHDDAPGLGHLVGIARTQDDQTGNRPQRGQLFDRLVRRPILADANRVVGKDVDRRNLHKGAQTDGGSGVIAEDEKAGSEGAHLGERHSVDDGAHCMFTNTEVEVATAVIIGAKITCALEGKTGFGRGRQIGSAADEPGHVLGDCA